MMAALARAVMILAVRCMGPSRQQWARAMQIEFEAAAADGTQFSFAIGCLIAACREMPTHPEGRLALADHALALGVLLPMAASQFLYAGGLAYSADVHAMLDSAILQNRYLGAAQQAAAPSLLLLWLILGVAHLRLAWVLLERDWPRVFSTGAMIVAGTATLAIYMGLLLLEDTRLILHAAASAVALTAIFAGARAHGNDWRVRFPEEPA